MRSRAARALIALVLGIVAAPLPGRAVPLTGGAVAADLASYVDPMIGTFGSGFVFPGPAAPFGMVQLSPDTEGYFAYTGYLWSDQFIRGFSHVHIESMGVHAGGDLPFMPTVGPITSTDPAAFRSKFDHATERAEPGYYRALLSTYGIDAELTAGTRVGMHRYTFPPSPQSNVIIDAGHSAAGTDIAFPQGVAPGTHPASLRVVDDRTVAGSVSNTDDGYMVHFAAEFSRPFVSTAGWNVGGGAPESSNSTPSGSGAGLAVTFDTTSDRTVLIRVGISFVSQANAVDNLRFELQDFGFDALRERTRAAWNDALKAITVTGGTELEKRSFYTALYHAQHHPNVFEDANGQYMGNDGTVHSSDGFTYYTNFSLWDTYRTENQLLALIQPDRFRDMMHSLLVIAQDGGRLPRWNLMNRYADFMNGEPAIPAIVDGYCRGLLSSEDVAPLYAEMRKLAMVQHRDPSYLEYGYIPHDVSDSGASGTQEHAIADFALALMADRLELDEDRDALLSMARNWQNVFDPQTRFIRPRLSSGAWVEPFDPTMPDGYREGTGWQYLWLEPHDVAELARRIGGAAPTIDRLDTFFSTALAEPVPYVVPEAQKHASLFGIAYYGNQFSPANEHDLQAPYLYDYVGQPWKTQALMRGLQGLYRPTPDGLPGNDDLGTMSAWFVWAALGFYPQTAGAPVYVIGSPMFERAEIAVPGGTFTVSAPGASPLGKYVQSATLDGSAMDKTWFTHDVLAAGRVLTLSMGASASSWGSATAAAPPSQSTHALDAFGCAG